VHDLLHEESDAMGDGSSVIDLGELQLSPSTHCSYAHLRCNPIYFDGLLFDSGYIQISFNARREYGTAIQKKIRQELLRGCFPRGSNIGLSTRFVGPQTKNAACERKATVIMMEATSERNERTRYNGT
jgi:hypothetical protein